jgi:hypothetical protein
MTPNHDSASHSPGTFDTVTHQGWATDALDDLWVDPDGTEALHEGGTHLLDLVAAVDHLARGIRHDFTVWDALEEAFRWWLTEQAARATSTLDDHDSALAGDDPLHARLDQLLTRVGEDPTTTAADALQQAIRRWTTAMADRYNAGYHWPHPTPRHSFPPPLINS